jgi:hypothetical protein
VKWKGIGLCALRVVSKRRRKRHIAAYEGFYRREIYPLMEAHISEIVIFWTTESQTRPQCSEAELENLGWKPQWPCDACCSVVWPPVGLGRCCHVLSDGVHGCGGSGQKRGRATHLTPRRAEEREELEAALLDGRQWGEVSSSAACIRHIRWSSMRCGSLSSAQTRFRFQYGA